MEEMQKYVDFQHSDPYEMKQTILNDKDRYVACLIGRMFEKQKKK